MIQPELEASIDLNGAMVFSYGFNLSVGLFPLQDIFIVCLGNIDIWQVPANSTLQVKIPDLSKSTVSGL